MILRIVPVCRDQALAFIARVHRHHGRPQGYRYAVGVALDGHLVGVATAGRPVNRHLDDGWTIEDRGTGDIGRIRWETRSRDHVDECPPAIEPNQDDSGQLDLLAEIGGVA